MKAVLFDLDDTLYPEREFVQSGFRAVARHLASRQGLDEDQLVRRMSAILEREGRGHVFDGLLHEYGLHSPEKVAMLVGLYRAHEPDIHLYADVESTLRSLRALGLRLGLVTDGMASVQRSKILALGLTSLMDAIVCTDELGPSFVKPSPVSFRLAAELLRVAPADVAYVGNDPTKDFAGARAAGLRTMRVRRHPYMSDEPLISGEDADIVVDGFTKLRSVLG